MKTTFNSRSIAVLPFVNIGKPDYEYFSDGISEEIINALTKIEGLKVTARTSSFFYKNKPLDARHIGNELGVETLLGGSARIINDRVRISAQLIRTDSGFHIWSESFDRELSDIFELQDEISLLIADKIRENFGHFDVQEHLVVAPTKDIEAYKLLLKARELRMRWNSKDVKNAITYLNQSIALDSSYADAHLEKGWCIGMLASWGYCDRKEGLQEANRHIDIGLLLKPHSAMGHYVKATISFWGYWNYKDAFEHLHKSIELNPNLSEVRDALADCYSSMGRIDDALANNEIALNLDPLSANLHFTKGNMVYFKERYKHAISLFEKAISINPIFPLAFEMKAAAFILDGQKEALSKFIQETPKLERPKTYMAIYNLMHKDEFFEVTDAEIIVERKSSTLLNLRSWDLYLEVFRGNHEKALQVLESKIAERSGQLFNFRNDPFLEPLRDYKKYREIEDFVFNSLNVPEFVIGSKKSEVSSPFTPDQLKNYTDAIEITMQENKLFTDPDLSLKLLAGDIDLHPNKLSWLLNNHLGKNFNDFINQYRIKEFQKLALDSENRKITLLGLAYDSGFNSKTVFNTFFKKETGMTPKQWVKSNS